MSDSKQQQLAHNQATQAQDQRALVPRVDVLEDETGITLLADLPGVAREQLDLKVEGETLQIEATVTPFAPEGLEAMYAEIRVPRYRRAFTLSRELDANRIEANLKDGVLKLRIPKQEHAQPRRIPIQVS
ncbi:Hsp20/alpha crystallin family protein [Eleftheria terrae]|uniref:Hsp20/alpha crystallin family protein n=1 Tax=Eleftheria terrae TaxID=1597781 RepID=UPI00263B244D|nr:Hsp20/alpha crystallin family protein [Eleftheria terrae]WKB53142.1 Hsp20/alpha crystallin family protein [Eleftheria terrae]